MEFKQMELVLGPTSIENLYYSQDADNETLADAMLLNWEDHGSLVDKDESWNLLRELPQDFILDDFLDEYDQWKGVAHRALIIQVHNRFFAYYYTASDWDSECYTWEEVKPVPVVKYDVVYAPKGGYTQSVIKSESYIKLFNQTKKIEYVKEEE